MSEVPKTKKTPVKMKVYLAPKSKIAPAPTPGPTIWAVRTTMLRATFPAFNLSAGKRLGRIACDAGAPSASPIPIKKTARANIQ